MKQIINNFNKRLSRFLDQLIEQLLLILSLLVVVILVAIFSFLFTTGVKTFSQVSFVDFIFGRDWNPTAYLDPKWGILSLIIGTLMVSGIAMLFVGPIGLAIAIFLAELTDQKQREIIKPLIEMIASIPSVVIGVLGLIFVAPFIARVFHLSNGLNALTAGILVAIAALPSVASLAEDALFNVPFKLREASLALGANQWETIKKVVIPAAKPGLVASMMLGLGRIIGETMIVLMVAGNSRAFPKAITDPVAPMTATIAVDIKEVVNGSLHYQSLFAIGLVLFVITFVINLVADLLSEQD